MTQSSTEDDVSGSSDAVDISHSGHHVPADARQAYLGKLPDLCSHLLCQREQRLQELLTCVSLRGEGERFLLPVLAPAGMTCSPGTTSGGIAHL